MEQRVSQFIQRIKNDGIKEIILALNPTHEGQTACLFLKRQIAPYKIKTSQLGIGLPLGGELEYADEETLAAALLGRN